ncbi:MAG TPA: hypothetical protein VMZ32_11690 [Gammaproteobacteria bacterium]|nr:hypothetical protein [Gammaproteobacteria bacterium]
MRISPKLEDCLREYGLFVRGVTRLSDAEIEHYSCDPSNPELALIGNIGSSYWAHFSQSVEFKDGAAHPLDRWSRRVAETIAKPLSLQALYPFDGPPYYPFQQWARRAESLEQSPIGVMIHPQFGLWHSYRFALLGTGFEVETAGICEPSAADSPRASPCLDCASKPCLHSCPVAAFDVAGYAVERCFDYLQQTPQAECHQQGCLARKACPVAPKLSYVAAQGRFHLRAFLQAQQARCGA